MRRDQAVVENVVTILVVEIWAEAMVKEASSSLPELLARLTVIASGPFSSLANIPPGVAKTPCAEINIAFEHFNSCPVILLSYD